MAQSHSLTGMDHVGHGVHELVLSAEFGAAARGRDSADGAGHAVVVPELRLACGRRSWQLGASGGRTGAGSLTRGRRGDPARVPHAGRARAGGGEERPGGGGAAAGRRSRSSSTPGHARISGPTGVAGARDLRLPPGWALAAAGLAVGLAAGTRVTVLAMAAALSVAVLVLAPAGRRRAAAALVVRAGAARRRLLVPAQPRRRRQPDAGDREVWGRSRCPIPSACRTAGPTSTSSTTRPTPASGATTSRPGLHEAFGALWPLVSARRRRRRRCWRSSAAATGSSAGSAASPSSACSPTCSPRSAPPAPRANRSASGSTSATSSRPCWPGSSCCRCRAFSTTPAPVGPAGGPGARLPRHRPS